MLFQQEKLTKGLAVIFLN